MRSEERDGVYNCHADERHDKRLSQNETGARAETGREKNLIIKGDAMAALTSAAPVTPHQVGMPEEDIVEAATPSILQREIDRRASTTRDTNRR